MATGLPTEARKSTSSRSMSLQSLHFLSRDVPAEIDTHVLGVPVVGPFPTLDGGSKSGNLGSIGQRTTASSTPPDPAIRSMHVVTNWRAPDGLTLLPHPCLNEFGNGVCHSWRAQGKLPASLTVDDSSQILMEVRSVRDL